MSALASLQALQARLQYPFKTPALLQQALTHRSYSADHNERLEFLGDSVLGLAVAHMLYEALGSGAEGDLSRLRAHLVRQDSLHRLALELDLSPLLRVGEGEMRSGGQRRPSILADAVEAILGAVYLEAGFPVAEQVVHQLFAKVDITPQMQAVGKDPKTALQEWLQGRRMALPQYDVEKISGAAHKQTFTVACMIPALRLGAKGQGHSRRTGEQAAAAAMLKLLQEKHPS